MWTRHINRAAGRIRYRREIHYSIFSAIFQEGTKTKLKFLCTFVNEVRPRKRKNNWVKHTRIMPCVGKREGWSEAEPWTKEATQGGAPFKRIAAPVCDASDSELPIRGQPLGYCWNASNIASFALAGHGKNRILRSCKTVPDHCGDCAPPYRCATVFSVGSAYVWFRTFGRTYPADEPGSFLRCV